MWRIVSQHAHRQERHKKNGAHTQASRDLNAARSFREEPHDTLTSKCRHITRAAWLNFVTTKCTFCLWMTLNNKKSLKSETVLPAARGLVLTRAPHSSLTNYFSVTRGKHDPVIYMLHVNKRANVVLANCHEIWGKTAGAKCWEKPQHV